LTRSEKMNATKIEYLNFTWSPLVGCSGKDCAVFAKCWARYQAKRRKHKCLACYNFTPHSHLERLEQPLKVKSMKRIGLCFSADIFDKAFVGSLELELVRNMVEKAWWHWFINLTKQPQNIPPKFPFPENWVQGVSVCRKDDLWRIDALRETNALWKCISFEPLYEDLGWPDLSRIDWVIIGAQTHPLKEPKSKWVGNLYLEAHENNIPVFIKNNLKGWDVKEYPELLQLAKTEKKE
jgi:protein gp37